MPQNIAKYKDEMREEEIPDYIEITGVANKS